METMVDLAVRRSVTVRASVERAFDVFTRGVASWWPLDTHSIRAARGGGRPEELHLEPRAGGRFYEKTGDEELRWGTVLECDPPTRIVIEWQVNPDRPATQIVVTFAAEDGGTRIELVHTGWERLGEVAHEARAGYGSDGGWAAVLRRFADAADA